MHVISDGCIYKILTEHNLYIDSISALQMQPFRSPNRDSDYENKVDAIGVLFNLHTITSMGVVTIVPKKQILAIPPMVHLTFLIYPYIWMEENEGRAE